MYMETKEKKWCVYIHINKFNNKSYAGFQWMYLEDYERMLSENAENGSV